MSAVNDSLKSGSKSCSSPDLYEDELVTWLQYPLEDSFEKSYCSDLFGQWPSDTSKAASAKTPPDVGAAKPPAGTSMAMARTVCTESGSLFRSNSAGASVNMGNCGVKERVGSGSLLRSSSAEGALALGAERAAGLVSQSGRDAFSKVRTSMQHPAGSQSNPLSSMKATGETDHSIRSNSIVIPGSFASKLPLQPTQGGLHRFPNSPRPMAGIRSQVSNSLALGAKGAISKSMSFTSDRSRKGSETHLLSPSAHQSGCSHITEEATSRRASDYASSASSRGDLCTAQYGGVLARLAPSIVNGHGPKKTAVGGVSEMALASCSGGSQTSADLSTREATYSGKRKLEDSECLSEDAEGESMETKPPHKSSSSKRNRAAEVHNLSERKRRNRINEKLKALQDLIPNSSKTDKASLLDEAIEYMKTLQMQLQIVSMRSGMNVSPMMIPMGMPHLQMAPLHPVGLGVPLGHAGMGMGLGLGMSMGMGPMDLSQGIMARPYQSIPPAMTHFSMPFQGDRSVVSSQDCSQVSAKMELTPSEQLLIPLNCSQPSDQMHPLSHIMSCTHLNQQHGQGQHLVHHSLDHQSGEHINEQTGKGV